MSVSSKIYKIYYASNVYIFSAILQIIICFIAIFLIWREKPEEVVYTTVAESLVFGIMIIDVLLYNIVNKWQISILNFLEWVFVLFFIVEFILHRYYEAMDELVKIIFACIRIVFLVARMFLGISRLHTIYQLEEEKKSFDLNEDPKENNTVAEALAISPESQI